MPIDALIGSEIPHNSIERNQVRSSRVVAYHRATFYRETIPRIRKLAMRFWRDALVEPDSSVRAQMSREFRELTELRRQLLGFPSPGRRRNEGEREERSIAVPASAEIEQAACAPANAPSESPASAPE